MFILSIHLQNPDHKPWAYLYKFMIGDKSAGELYTVIQEGFILQEKIILKCQQKTALLTPVTVFTAFVCKKTPMFVINRIEVPMKYIKVGALQKLLSVQ